MPEGEMGHKLVFISGTPRSGSTILGMLLGQRPNCVDIGEFWALWRPAYRQGDLCGCGQPVPTCPFWKTVFERVFGTQVEAEGFAMGDLHKAALGTKRSFRAFFHVRNIKRDDRINQYQALLERHYRAVEVAAEASTIIDSSKMPGDALVAGSIDGRQAKIVHVVRDPRGLVYSWQKQHRQPGPKGKPIVQAGVLGVCARWLFYNLFAELFLKSYFKSDGFRSVRYEDLVENPSQAFGALVEWLTVDDRSLPLTPTTANVLLVVKPSHPVWGNPVRTKTGAIKLRVDDAWQATLTRSKKALTTLLCLPLLIWYRYPIFSPKPGDRVRTG